MILKTWWSFRYAMLTVQHKYFVFKAGLRTGASLWLLLIHDYSKFSLTELPAYGRQFFGDRGDPDSFSVAWLHHQNTNPHHFEYWVPRSSTGSRFAAPLPMPMKYVREMVADWLGASRAYSNIVPTSRTSWPWFQEKWPVIKRVMHPDTITRVEQVLTEAGL